MSLEFLAAADRLVSASLNGLYQGLIVTAVVALCLRLGRTNAATRHAAWLATLLVVALLIPAHCLRQNLSWGPPEATQLAAGSTAAAEPTTETLNPELTTGTELEPIAGPVFAHAEGPIAGDDAETEPEFDRGGLSEMPREGERSAAAEDPVRSAFVSRILGRLMNPVAFSLGLGAGPGRYASVGVLVLWLAMTGVCIGVLLLRLQRIRCLKRSSSKPGRTLQAVFDQVKTEMRPKRAVNLRVSSTQLSPVVLGFFEPMVLLPAALPLNESEQILRHELAHACRADDWANLFQHCVSAVLFFHPAVWWIGRRLSLEREIACDDQVLRHGGRPRAYALLLADLAGRVHGQTARLAPGASNNKSQLQQRIDMILNTNRNTSARLAKTRLGVITTAAALLAGMALYAGPRVVLAQAALPAPAPAPSSDFARAGVPAVAFAPALPVPGPSAELPEGATAFDYKDRSANPYVPAPPAAVAVPPAPTVPAWPGPARMNSLAQSNTPRPPRPARPGEERTSLEERLDRLEKMVESLLAQPGPRLRSSEFHLKGPDRPGAPAKLIDPKQLEQIKQRAKQEAEHARSQAEFDKQMAEQNKQIARREAGRAVEELKRTIKESEHGPKQEAKRQPRVKAKNQQLEALKRQLEALEHQKEKLSQEIERLSRDQEKLQTDLDEEIDLNLDLNLDLDLDVGLDLDLSGGADEIPSPKQ